MLIFAGGMNMGSRNFSGREKKKPKKDNKKQSISSEIQDMNREIEVIRKGKKSKEKEYDTED
jgi:hypothetical protein